MAFNLAHSKLMKEITSLAVSARSSAQLMQGICDAIHSAVARYNWVAFFVLDSSRPDLMVLAAYQGSFVAPHETRPVDSGMCGAAMASGKTVVANEVSADHTYVVADDMVKSEIAAPILSSRGKVLGVIDVESYFGDTFAQEEPREFVEWCASVVAKSLEKRPWGQRG